MSTILKFPLERVNKLSFFAAGEIHNADILVFQGVRYEKMEPPKKLTKVSKQVTKSLV